MSRAIQIGDRMVGDGFPTYVVAEIGINHNGSVEIAKKMIDAAKHAGVDAVKFQKRTPELCVPPDQRNVMRETPWGYITYLDYRYKVEFDQAQYEEIDQHCKEIGIHWFASVWDESSIDFMEKFDPIAYKVPSASLTDHALLRRLRTSGRSIILSTGMSTMEQIEESVKVLGSPSGGRHLPSALVPGSGGTEHLMITHATSTYPCDPEELNLKMIGTLRQKFPFPIGYSGHEVGLIPSVVAVALGACLVERHITLDRAMWGSDQAASVEGGGFERMVHYIRVTEASLGDGIKKVYGSEMSSMKKLRRVVS